MAPRSAPRARFASPSRNRAEARTCSRPSPASKQAGAWVLALVNDTDSPLCDLADEVFDLAAGPERSVAATKSFIASLAAIARVVAAWGEDRGLRGELDQLPGFAGQGMGARLVAADARPCRRDRPLRPRPRARIWRSRRKRRSSSRKRRSCTPRRSAPPSFGTGRWRWSARGFPALMFSQSDETASNVEETASGSGRARCGRVRRRCRSSRRDVAADDCAPGRCSSRSCRSSPSTAPPMRSPSRAASIPTVRRTSPK